MTKNCRLALTCLTVGAVLGAAIGQLLHHGPASPAAFAQSGVLQPRSAAPAPPARSEAPPGNFTADELRNIQVYEAVNRSVVNIDTRAVFEDSFSFFPVERAAEGAGSGWVLDKQGHIVTNFHVIDMIDGTSHSDVQVTLANNETYPAQLVGGDKEHDIAVLKVDAPADQLFPIVEGRSDNLRIGQRVYAVGNPFGWDGTMTTGIISSLNRNLPSRVSGRQMESLIQTDAAMNPGNSGGPLLNTSGQIIGMCVAIAGHAGQNSGVGFAIPIDRIKWILPQLIERGHVVRADIGIKDVVETDGGGLIIRVMDPEGPAAKAGLHGFQAKVVEQRTAAGVIRRLVVDRSQADRIVAVDGQPMRTGVQFRDQVWSHQPGDTITVTVIRDGQQVDVQVTLGEG